MPPIALSQEDIALLNEVTGLEWPFGSLTEDQILYLQSLLAYIKAHRG